MNTSSIAAALSKAQSKITGAIKDSTNPHFKSQFATLASVMDAIREPFAENGLAVVQPTVWLEGKLFIKTIIMHSSGESIEGIYPVICKDWNNPQAVGSGMSYGRRYALSSMVSLPQIDDDANEATEVVKPKFVPKEHTKSTEAYISKKGSDIGNYRIKVGKFKDRQLKEVDQLQIQDYITWLNQQAKANGKPLSGDWLEFAKIAEAYLFPNIDTTEPLT